LICGIKTNEGAYSLVKIGETRIHQPTNAADFLKFLREEQIRVKGVLSR
jgi:hypothetical protein